MPRTVKPLTDLAVRKMKTPGRYADGDGLYLIVDAKGKRWFYFFRWAGKRKEMGLGSAGGADEPGKVSLAAARDLRNAYAAHLAAGRNPILVRNAEREARRLAEETALPPHTFASWAAELQPTMAPKTPKSHGVWLRMLTEWTGPLAAMALPDIQTEHVLAALKPYWKSRPATAKIMRERIERVLDAARAKGLITGAWENPARWKGHLQHLLDRPKKAPKHHAAMPYDEVPAFFQQLASIDTMAARALRFTILTVARTSEVIHARHAEVWMDVWACPPERMKMGREHRVPLPPVALDIIESAKPPNVNVTPDDWLFPSTARRGKPLSTAAMDRLLAELGYRGTATVHGFRSAFRDWAGDCTNFSRETIEAAMAHLVGDEAERAYRRGDALLKRRKLMEAWAGFLMKEPGAGVVDLAGRRRQGAAPVGR